MPNRPKLHRSEFIRQLRSEVPEVDPFLVGMRESLTEELSVIAAFARQASADGAVEPLARLFQFMARAHGEANRTLRNAIAASFLEHLPFQGPEGLRAFELLPQALRAEWSAVHEYMLAVAGVPVPVVGASPSNISVKLARSARRLAQGR